MRRDEIKIFPGNVETHIRRLHHFTDSSPPIGREHMATSPSADQHELQYTSPATNEAARKTWWKNARREVFSGVSNAMVFVAVVVIAFLFAVPLAPISKLTIVSIFVLLAPGVLIGVHMLHRFLQRP
jgi:hypothetical protein